MKAIVYTEYGPANGLHFKEVGKPTSKDVGCFYFLALKPVAKMGNPSFSAQFLAFAFILVPLELGFLFYQGKKKTGRVTLRGIISYQKSIPWWQYFVWVTIIFVIVGALMTLFKPVDSFLQKNLFFFFKLSLFILSAPMKHTV